MKDIRLTAPFSLLAIVLVLFIGAPIANIYGVQLFQDFPGLVRAATDPAVYQSIWLSVYASGVAAFSAFLFGTPLAYILARKDFPGKTLIARIIDLPMVIPHIAAGIMLYGIFNRSGLVGGLVDEFLLFEDALPGIVVAMLFVSLPFYVNSAREGFESVNPRLEHVSRTLGQTPWRTFFKVSFPLASSHLLTGAIMGWARGISEYAAIAIIAYYPKTAPVMIRDRFTAYGLSSSRPATILLVTICLVTFIFLWSFAKDHETDWR
jgi:molybdate/tungstate transport system permease protein